MSGHGGYAAISSPEADPAVAAAIAPILEDDGVPAWERNALRDGLNHFAESQGGSISLVLFVKGMSDALARLREYAGIPVDK